MPVIIRSSVYAFKRNFKQCLILSKLYSLSHGSLTTTTTTKKAMSACSRL